MKHQRAGSIESLFKRRGQPVNVPTPRRIKMFVNFWLCDQTKIGQGSSIYFFSIFTTVQNANNGRLDQWAWLKRRHLGWFFQRWSPYFALIYHGYTTPPTTKDTTCTATSVGRSASLVCRTWCSTVGLHIGPFKTTAKRKYKLPRKLFVVFFR